MAFLVKVLSALPGMIVGIKGILDIFVRYFPPKSEGERAVDKFKDQVTHIREVQLELNKQIKEAKLGKTKAIEDIINSPK